jgi:hypothetical protein
MMIGCSSGADGTADEGMADTAGSSSTAGTGVSSGSAGGSLESAGSASNGSGGATSSNGGAPNSGGGAVGTGGKAGSANAGGSTNNGGATGMDASIPHVIGQCSALAPVGQWEKITPPGMRHGPAAFGVDPIHAGTVYLGTGDGCFDNKCDGVMKTTDCGATWVKINSGKNGDLLDKGDQWGFAIDPVDPKIMYTTSGYGANGLYKSTNGGVDWEDVTPKGDGSPGWVGSGIQLDPDDHNHLLIRWHAPCGKYEDQIGCFAETKDGGATWKEHYGTPKWAPEVTPYLLHGSSWIINVNGISLTTDGGATYKKVSDAGAGGHSAGGIYRGKGGAYYIGTSAGVLRSAPGASGMTWAVAPGSGSWVQGVTGNGDTIFAASGGGVLSAPESDGLGWKSVPSSPRHGDGCFSGYDQDHHILYASCMADGGFWRMVTQ